MVLNFVLKLELRRPQSPSCIVIIVKEGIIRMENLTLFFFRDYDYELRRVREFETNNQVRQESLSALFTVSLGGFQIISLRLA